MKYLIAFNHRMFPFVCPGSKTDNENMYIYYEIQATEENSANSKTIKENNAEENGKIINEQNAIGMN